MIRDRHLRLVEYRRTSTEDRGQDPNRQGDVITAWAIPAGHEIVGSVTDMGTSGGVPALMRPKVKEAIRLCKAERADGLVVEAIDRWTRKGIEDLSVSRFFLRMDHGLVLRVANSPPGLPPAFEQLWDSMMAAAAEAWLQRHSEAVRTGYARARKAGFPNGRPGPKEKPCLTRDELDYVAYLRQDGFGWRKLALELSRARGAFDVVDTNLQRRKRIGPTWLRAEFARIAAHSDRRCYRKAAEPAPIGVDTAHPEGK